MAAHVSGTFCGKGIKSLEKRQVFLEWTIPMSFVVVFFLPSTSSPLKNYIWIKISIGSTENKQIYIFDNPVSSQSHHWNSEPTPHTCTGESSDTGPLKAIQWAPINVCLDGMLTRIGPLPCNLPFVIYKKSQINKEGCT